MKLRPGLIIRHDFAMPTVVGSGTFANSAGSNNLFDAPMGDAANDIILCCLHTNQADAVSFPGYTAVTGSPVNIGVSSRLHVAWRRATDTNNGTTITATNGFQGILFGVRGCNLTGNPWNAIQASTQLSSISISITGVTTPNDASLIVVILAHEISASGAQASAAA